MNSAFRNVLLLITVCGFRYVKCFGFIYIAFMAFTYHDGCSTLILLVLKLYMTTITTRHWYPLFQVILEDSFSGHQGNDLYDPDKANYRIFRVKKSATLQDFLEQVAESLVSSHVTCPLYGNIV